jgi:hypothetical protein
MEIGAKIVMKTVEAMNIVIVNKRSVAVTWKSLANGKFGNGSLANGKRGRGGKLDTATIKEDTILNHLTILQWADMVITTACTVVKSS